MVATSSTARQGQKRVTVAAGRRLRLVAELAGRLDRPRA
jgi:hypothetical protein